MSGTRRGRGGFATRVLQRGEVFRRVRRSAFTFIEWVIALAIIGVLAVGVFPLAEVTAKRAMEQELHAGPSRGGAMMETP